MHASTVIGGFSQGHADILRKAIGSKKMDLIEEWVGYMINGSEEHGIEGGIARGFDPKMLERLQKEWIAFGDYAFNKSH